jgi:hypothetical protein
MRGEPFVEIRWGGAAMDHPEVLHVAGAEPLRHVRDRRAHATADHTRLTWADGELAGRSAPRALPWRG